MTLHVQFPIEHGIPMPRATQRAGRKAIYPWHEMLIGDMFFVPLSEGGDIRKLQRALSAHASVMTRRSSALKDRKFRTRKITHNGVEGVGVWRIA